MRPYGVHIPEKAKGVACESGKEDGGKTVEGDDNQKRPTNGAHTLVDKDAEVLDNDGRLDEAKANVVDNNSLP
jgi:hypothetical protein